MFSNISIKDQFRALILGITTSWIRFVKYGKHIFYFDVQNSLSKDWNVISDDIKIAIQKFEEKNAAKKR